MSDQGSNWAECESLKTRTTVPYFLTNMYYKQRCSHIYSANANYSSPKWCTHAILSLVSIDNRLTHISILTKLPHAWVHLTVNHFTFCWKKSRKIWARCQIVNSNRVWLISAQSNLTGREMMSSWPMLVLFCLKHHLTGWLAPLTIKRF